MFRSTTFAAMAACWLALGGCALRTTGSFTPGDAGNPDTPDDGAADLSIDGVPDAEPGGDEPWTPPDVIPDEEPDPGTEAGDGDIETPDDDGGDPAEDPSCMTGETRCEAGRMMDCVAGSWADGPPCAMGCTAAGDRCLRLLPSNAGRDLVGLGDAALVISARTIVDTDSGSITTGTGEVIRPAGEGYVAGINFALAENSCNDAGIFSVAGLTVEAGGMLEARGSRTLVILATGRVEIAGQISVSAVSQTPGAGGFLGGGRGEAGQGPCGGQPGSYYQSLDDSGSGGAGHLQGGGNGGVAGSAAAGPGGTGGTACSQENLVPLCGGSGGGGSYGPDYPNRGSEGGTGGGAVQVSSEVAVVVMAGGSITAGGGGASGGHPGGGGGGGAGGGILVEAPVVEVIGAISAGGGGGGSGGYQPDGLPGSDGDAGGAGGPAPTSGSAGGSGGASGTPAGGPGSPHGANAGGGGGSAGRIRFNTLSGSATVTGTTSPTTVSNGTIGTY